MIQLNHRDGRPIYEQIVEGFRKLILSGALQEGDKLPSVRELSTQLAVNPNTIQRAYRELEAEGCVYAVPAKGIFARAPGELRREKIDTLKRELRETAAQLRALGVTPEELRRELEGSTNDRDN